MNQNRLRPGRNVTCQPCRVLFLDHTAELSGGEIAMLRLVTTLDRSRHIPVVLLFSHGPLEAELEKAGVETHVMPLAKEIVQTRKDTLGISTLLRLSDAMALFSFAIRVSKFIRSRSIDLVHANSLKSDIIGGIAGPMAGVKVIWHLRDRIASDYLPAGAVRIFRLLCRILPDYVIANSRATLDTIGGGVPGMAIPSGLPVRSRLQVVHDGMAHPDAIRGSDQANTSDTLRLGLIGRISPWKGQHIFLQAARQVIGRFPTAEFHIIGSSLFGEDQYEREIHSLTTKLGLEKAVKFLGFRKDILDLIGNLDIVVHASTLPEPFGQVVIEAMAMSKPVIATAGGGITEIVLDGQTGLLVPMNDAGAMANAMVKLLGDPDLRTRMGRMGRERFVSQFTIELTAARVQALYDNLLTTSRINRRRLPGA